MLAFNRGRGRVIASRIDRSTPDPGLINKMVEMQQAAARDVLDGSVADTRLMLMLFGWAGSPWRWAWLRLRHHPLDHRAAVGRRRVAQRSPAAS